MMENPGFPTASYTGDGGGADVFMHYGQGYNKPPRQKTKYAFGRTYFEEEEENRARPPEDIKYHNYVYVSDDEGGSVKSRGSSRNGRKNKSAAKREKSPMEEKEYAALVEKEVSEVYGFPSFDENCTIVINILN